MVEPQYIQNQKAFIFDKVNQLVSNLTPFNPSEKNYGVVSNFVFKNIRENKFPDTSSFKVKAEINGLIEKFNQFNKIEIANRLQTLWNKCSALPFANPYEITDLKYSAMQLLLSLANTPLQTKYDPSQFVSVSKKAKGDDKLKEIMEQLNPTEEELNQWQGSDSEHDSISEEEQEMPKPVAEDEVQSKKQIACSPKYKDESTSFGCTNQKSNILDMLGVRKDPTIVRTVPSIVGVESINISSHPLSEVPSNLFANYLKEVCEKGNQCLYIPRVTTESELLTAILLAFEGCTSSLLCVTKDGIKCNFEFELSHVSYSCIRTYVEKMINYAVLFLQCEKLMILKDISCLDILVYYCKGIISNIRKQISKLQIILLYQTGHTNTLPDMEPWQQYSKSTMTIISTSITRFKRQSRADIQ